MPTYEYECLQCGKNFDFFQKISDSHLKQCPKCKGKVKRLISSGGGLIFKGKGFYSTDYKKKNTSKPNTDSAKPCSGCSNSDCGQAQKKE